MKAGITCEAVEEGMDGGVVVESGNPRDVLTNPQHERTQSFLSKVL